MMLKSPDDGKSPFGAVPAVVGSTVAIAWQFGVTGLGISIVLLAWTAIRRPEWIGLWLLLPLWVAWLALYLPRAAVGAWRMRNVREAHAVEDAEAMAPEHA